MSLANDLVANALRNAWALAPSLPPSSMAKGTRTWEPPWGAAMGCLEVLHARNFLSSAFFCHVAKDRGNSWEDCVVVNGGYHCVNNLVFPIGEKF